MMIFKQSIPRRTFLRSMGTALALPLLDGMVPALAGAADAAAKPLTRVAYVYLPNGRVMEKWTPTAEGPAFELSPILEPLAPFRDRLLVLSELCHTIATTGVHAPACTGYLTGVYKPRSAMTTVAAGTSVDQIVATQFGKSTQLASLEITLDSDELVGQCEAACAYTNTISWRTATMPLPMENNPRAVFERLFGDGASTDPAARLARIKGRRSILDSLTEDADRLLGRLGPGDRGKLSEYFDAIRDIERRIQLVEDQSSRELPRLDRPAGVPTTFQEHAKLMFDLLVVAYQADLTRVSTFMMGHEVTARTYSEIGISDPHHPLSHHAGDATKIAKVTQIDIYQTKMFAYYLDKLLSTPDGDGSLLDHTTIVYGGGLSDGNLHLHNNLPILLLPGKNSQIKTGRHIRLPKETPLVNLHLTLLADLGIPVEKFGDSTGKLELLTI